MKRLFVVTGEGIPDIYVKAKDSASACAKFATSGWTEEESAKYVNHPSFQVREVTLELFDQLTPDEFQIHEDTSF